MCARFDGVNLHILSNYIKLENNISPVINFKTLMKLFSWSIQSNRSWLLKPLKDPWRFSCHKIWCRVTLTLTVFINITIWPSSLDIIWPTKTYKDSRLKMKVSRTKVPMILVCNIVEVGPTNLFKRWARLTLTYFRERSS